jgi:molybdate-binding protein/DNA-binding transcriptional regulator YhcF (GntR family)
MQDDFLYRQIAEAIRQEIMSGERRPGDRLPSVREMTANWGCTLGTVQRAYQELARQGLVTSRAGQGTRVVESLSARDDTPLRRAALVHRAEGFLLEVLTAGYAPADVEEAIRLALERWRQVEQGTIPAAEGELRFVGSHDPAMAWLAGHFGEIAVGYTLRLSFTGSLGGLIALAQGKADLAGCHLWDEEADTTRPGDSYNLPFVQRLLPGRRMAVVTLAHRRLGLMVAPGNPAGLHGLADLAQPGLRFVNRQPGSGTRVWLDAQLRRLGIPRQAITGYENEMLTHSDVALAIAEGHADAGVGLEGAARIYGLGVLPLTRERYDLVIPEAAMQSPAMEALLNWLNSSSGKQAIMGLGGYEVDETGALQWVA